MNRTTLSPPAAAFLDRDLEVVDPEVAQWIHGEERRQKAFELKQQQVEATGAESVVMSCGSCRLNFMSGQANTGWPVKIESLVELVGENLED